MVLPVNSFGSESISNSVLSIPSTSPSKCRNHGQCTLCFRNFFEFTLWSCVQSLWTFPVISDQYIIRLDQEFRTFERNSGMVLDWNRNTEWIGMMRLTWRVRTYCWSRICFDVSDSEYLWNLRGQFRKCLYCFFFYSNEKWHPTLQPFFADSCIN